MTSFADAAKISKKYISLKYGNNVQKSDWLDLALEAGKVIEVITKEKSDIYSEYPGVHGRFQQSQLDVLDQREQKMVAVFNNAVNMSKIYA